jgi:hypothetical protein
MAFIYALGDSHALIFFRAAHVLAERHLLLSDVGGREPIENVPPRLVRDPDVAVVLSNLDTTNGHPWYATLFGQ